MYVPLITFSVDSVELQLNTSIIQNVSGSECIPAYVLQHCATEIALIITKHWRGSIRLAESIILSLFLRKEVDMIPPTMLYFTDIS